MGGKGGSKIEVSQYQMSIHLGLALEVDSVTAAYYGEKRYWSGKVQANTTINVSNTGLFGGNKKEGGIQGNMTFLMGRSDQVLPDAFAQKLGYSSGAECPGFRGITSILHTGPAPSGQSGWMWCSNSPYLKSMWYTVVSIPKALGTQYSRVNDIQTQLDIKYDSEWKYRVVPTAQGGEFGRPSQYIDPEYDDSDWAEGKGGFGSGGPGSGLGVGTYIPPSPAGTGIWIRRKILVNNPSLAPDLHLSLYHDDGCALWWNGERITVTQSVNYFRSTATIPAAKVLSENTVVMQVLDSVPGGSSQNIYCGLTIAPSEAVSEIVDANPAHIIYEVLTDGQFGMGLDPATAIDIPSFLEAAKTLFEEGLGLSMAWSSSTSAEDFINEVKDHINALLFPDPETGKMVLKLIRDDYSTDDLRTVNPDNAKVKAYSKKSWGDTINEIVVTWTNPTNEAEETVTLQDNGNIAEQGEVVSDAKNYYGVRSSALAWRLASRELRVASSPLSSAELELDRSFWNLRPGDCIKLTWPEYGVTELVMRVWKVAYGRRGSSSITATVTEDVFSLPVSAFVQPPSTEWIDPSKPPQAIIDAKVVTLPAYAVGQVSGTSLSDFPYPIAYAGVLGADPNGDTPSFNLLAETVDATSSRTWVDRGTMVTSGYHKLATTLSAEVDSTSVNLTQVSGALPIKGSFLFIGSGGDSETEVCLVSEIVSGLMTLARGVLDTVPRSWPVSTPVWVVSGDFLIADQTQQSAGATPDYKLLPNTSTGQLSEALAPILTGTLTDRLHAPLRPANVSVNGVKFGTVIQENDSALSVTFARRNRLTEETVVLKWDDPDVTPEPGQTTAIVVTEVGGQPLKTISDVAGTSASIDVSDVTTATVDGDGYSNAIIKFYAERSGIRSLQAHQIGLKFRGGLQIVTQTLPAAKVGVSYSQNIVVSGGALPLAWSIATGALPAGLSIASGTGLISGTPTTATTGSPDLFEVRVTDATSAVRTRQYGISVAPANIDPYWDNVSALMHFDGVDGSTAFVDSSPRPKTVTRSGTARISTDQFKFGSGSLFLDGADSEINFGNVSDFGFGTGDFTWECFVRRSNANCVIFDNRSSGADTNSIVCFIDPSGNLCFYRTTTTTGSGQTVPSNTWTHVAWCRSAGVMRMFIGGIKVSEASMTSDMGSSRPMRIGRDIVNNADFSGYVDDVRITKGAARYTANFTPPNASFPDS